MRGRTFWVLSVIILGAFSAPSARGDVRPIGPDGGTLSALAIDRTNPRTLYAGAHYAGVFKSTDAGAHWDFSGLAGYTVNTLAIDPQNPAVLYAGVFVPQDDGDERNPGIFKSTDGGKSWTSTNAVSTFGCTIEGLAVDPRDSLSVYASACDGFLRSSDGGETWSAANSGFPHLDPRSGSALASLVIDPMGTLFITAYQCDTTGRFPAPACDTDVFKSSDGGGSWRKATAAPISNSMVTALAIDPVSPSTLYARIMFTNVQNGVIKSTDSGATWVRTSLDLGQGCCIAAVAVDPAGAVYAAGFGGLFKSMDGGTGWRRIGYFPPLTGISALAFDAQNSDTVYVVDSLGISKSTDGGAGWNKANSGLRAAPVFSIALDPQRAGSIYAGGFGIATTTDSGTSWTAGKSAAREYSNFAYALQIDPADPNTIYAAVGERGEDVTFGGAVLKSVDGGGTWNVARSGITTPAAVTSLVADPRHPGTLYVGTWGGGVFKSVDGAMSWNAMDAGLPAGDFQPVITALTIDPQQPETVYAGALSSELPGRRDPHVFKSTDGGLNWILLPQTFLRPGIQCCPEITAMATDGSTGNIYVVTTNYAGPGGTLWKSTDSGATWRDILPTSSSASAVAVDSQTADTIYASTDTGLLVSLDGGENWAPLPGGPSLSTTLALDPLNPNTLYAAGWSGLFAITIGPSDKQTQASRNRLPTKDGR
jgi:photosystem II stability/assembly factor-like uncharacterized protein